MQHKEQRLPTVCLWRTHSWQGLWRLKPCRYKACLIKPMLLDGSCICNSKFTLAYSINSTQSLFWPCHCMLIIMIGCYRKNLATATHQQSSVSSDWVSDSNPCPWPSHSKSSYSSTPDTSSLSLTYIDKHHDWLLQMKKQQQHPSHPPPSPHSSAPETSSLSLTYQDNHHDWVLQMKK